MIENPTSLHTRDNSQYSHQPTAFYQHTIHSTSFQKPALTKYISDALNWVIFQLVITSTITGIMYYKRTETIQYVKNHTWFYWIPVLSTFAFLLIMFFTSSTFSRRISFVMFTISCSFIPGFSILQYSPETVLNAAITTACVVVVVKVYAHRCAKNDIDFGYLESGLFSILTTIVFASIVGYFYPSSIFNMIIAVVSVLLFTAYLLFDLTRLYSGRDYYDNIFTDPVFAATEIYLDIINLFVNIAYIINNIDSN